MINTNLSDLSLIMFFWMGVFVFQTSYPNGISQYLNQVQPVFWRHLSKTWILFMSVWSDQYWRYWNPIIEFEMSYRHFLIVQSISSFPIIWWLSHIRNMSKFQTRDEVQCSLSSNKNCCPLTIIASSIANWVLIMQFGLKSKWPCVIEQLFGSWTFFANASFKIYVKLQHVILQVS